MPQPASAIKKNDNVIVISGRDAGKRGRDFVGVHHFGFLVDDVEAAMKDVEAAYDKVVAQIRAQYSIGYTSTNTALDGRWRRVQIRVVGPELKDARIQSRKGYFALYKETP